MKRLKGIICAIASAVLALSLTVSAFASVKTMPDGTVFDAEYYAENNPDVVAAYGRSEAALYDHYIHFGKNEGRKPCAPSSGTAVTSVNTPAPSGNVYEKLIALKSKYPEGMKWSDENKYVYTAKTDLPGWNPTFTVTGCQAFAYTIQDEIFGTTPQTPRYQVDTPLAKLYGNGSGWTLSKKSGCWVPVGYDGNNAEVNQFFDSFWPTIKPGDLLADGIHGYVVLTKDDNGITVVEGNYSGKVHWGRRITKDQLRMGLHHIDRY